MSQNTGKTILVIDDDAMNREVMEAFLTSENYLVLLAQSGEDGISQAQSAAPDGIILDVRMPDMTGYDVCTHLKADETTQSIPVMIVTGFDSKEDRERGVAAGADDFLPRPFDGENLLQRVAALVSN